MVQRMDGKRYLILHRLKQTPIASISAKRVCPNNYLAYLYKLKTDA